SGNKVCILAPRPSGLRPAGPLAVLLAPYIPHRFAPGMLVARALPAGLGASSKMYTLFPDGPLVGSPLPTSGTPVPRELCAYQENVASHLIPPRKWQEMD